MGNELDNDLPESVYSNPSAPMGSARKHVFDKGLKESAWDMAVNFPDTSPLLCGLRKAGVSKERITVLTIDALMQQCKSAACAKSTIKHVSGMARFTIDFRTEEQVALTGESSLAIIHDYIEQAASRG